MVLDLDLFREDKGFVPEKIRQNQISRFKDVGLVDTVIDKDKAWRQLRHKADNFNKLKNLCSKVIGEKMKKKTESQTKNEKLLQEIAKDLDDKVTSDNLKALDVDQIKQVRVFIDEAIKTNDLLLEQTELERNKALREVGNILHPSVPISNNEDENKVKQFLDSSLLIQFLSSLFFFCNRSKELLAIA